MRVISRKVFLVAAAALILFGAPIFAANHHLLNGTWILDPVRSNFQGQPVIQTGTITIYDREHNLYVSRNFSYEGADETMQYSFSTDGEEHSTVREGKTIKSKAKWEGDVVRVVTMNNGEETVEHFSLMPDDHLVLVVERPDHPTVTLYFHRG